jgi:hypothetical protein
MTSGLNPTFSMMSISPQAGQSFSTIFVPNIQMAGQVPSEEGIFALTSNLP